MDSAIQRLNNRGQTCKMYCIYEDLSCSIFYAFGDTGRKAAEWTTGWRPSDCSCGEEDVAESVAESAISEFNAAMGKLSEVATTRQVSPLTFQLKTTWDEAKEHEKEVCIDKATEACSLVCEIRELKMETFSGRQRLDRQGKPGTKVAVASRHK